MFCLFGKKIKGLYFQVNSLLLVHVFWDQHRGVDISDRSDDSTLEGLGVLLIWELAARAGAKGSKRGPSEHSNPLL